MKTKELLNLLKSHQDKFLLFEYETGKLVGTNYHITEVKHLKIDSVDCGGQVDNWNETIVQLWESPMEIGKKKYMSALKALGILNKVAKMKPYDYESEIKIEYSNKQFNTAQLFISDFLLEDNNLILKLAIEKTDCKAKDLCGVVEKIVEEVMEPCCSPDGNCC